MTEVSVEVHVDLQRVNIYCVSLRSVVDLFDIMSSTYNEARKYASL